MIWFMIFFISSLLLTWNCQALLPFLQGPMFLQQLSQTKIRCRDHGPTVRNEIVHDCPMAEW